MFNFWINIYLKEIEQMINQTGTDPNNPKSTENIVSYLNIYI